ncbi:hypothetical protein GCM10010987_62990 [Bradyrhizobium guangdongense]|uniref:Uncharacterized protein n=1 Tax=Bradyrhizobium guangdongense TaxID=1325090 RepID=A0AA88B9S5_9BRAD|nr:hypothetical protein GCM10010987_62990 [Bradyrhizobium guangdongense]
MSLVCARPLDEGVTEPGVFSKKDNLPECQQTTNLPVPNARRINPAIENSRDS